MKIFFSSLVAILVGAAIIAVIIGINRTEGLEPQNVVTTNQDLSFASPGGELVIPARTTLHVVRFMGR